MADNHEIDQVALQTLRGPDRTDERGQRLDVLEDVSNVSLGTVADDLRPSRRYQMLLVLAGSLMTFHVIGINSIYGLFQVCLFESIAFSCIGRISPFIWILGVLYFARDQYRGHTRTRRVGISCRHHW